MMNGPEKSDPGIVAMKPTNKAEGPPAARPAEETHAAEPVERRAGTKGNAGQQSTRRTQRRESVSQALDRIRRVSSTRSAVTHPRWEKLWGRAAKVVAPSSSLRTDGVAPWPKLMISAEA
jgi:hypothetical protein